MRAARDRRIAAPGKHDVRTATWLGAVLAARSAVGQPAGAAHRLHRLLDGQDERGLDRLDVARSDGGEYPRRGRRLVRVLRDNHAVVLAKGVEDVDQPA